MPTRVYVGDLGDQGTRGELQHAFSKYGNVVETWVARNPPGFAFVFFESRREAEDAARNLDGTNICGVRVRCEIARGPDKGEKARDGPKCYECGRIGHSTRDCTRRPGYIFRGRNSNFQMRRGGGGGHYNDRRRSRSRSRDFDRPRYRRSRSGSPPRHKKRDSRTPDRRRSRSRTPERRRSRSRSRDRRSHSRGKNRGSPYRDDGRQEEYNDDAM